MTLESFPTADFGGGLNLRDKPDVVSQAECIDAMNVIFTDRGAVQQRAGFAQATPSALTNRVASLEPFYRAASPAQLLAGCGTRLEALNTGFEVVASASGLSNELWDFARFGQPNAEVAYAGNGTDTLRKWSGSAWSAPTATVDGVAGKAMPKAGSICVQPWDNRLVCGAFSTATGGPNGGISSPSHVYFSNEGDSESYESTGYLQFTPGDGEKVMATIAWREFVFVFKETRFFVITGTSTDSAGKPEFNYRPVEAGVGLASSRAVCVHPSGVYFMARNGIYRTTGEEPELVSSLIEPIWNGDISSFYTGGVLAHNSIGNCAMTTYEDRIYLSFPTVEANNRTLVYDPQFEWWSLTDFPASCLATFRPAAKTELVFGYASGANHVGRHAFSYTNDADTAISSRWRSGWFDLDLPDIKTIRSSKLWGTGKVFAGLGYDFRQEPGALEALDFTDPTVDTWGGTTWGGGKWSAARGLVATHKRAAVRGTVFSLYFANSIKDQTWAVHRAVHQTREVARPSEATA